MLESLGPFLFGTLRAVAVNITETTIVLFGVVIRYPDFVWGLGWVVLAAIAILYMPELVRPQETEWPSGLVLRFLFAMPVVWAGVLAESLFRGLLTPIVGPTVAPFVAPLTLETVGGNFVMTVGLFGAVYWRHEREAERLLADIYGLVGYLLRAVVLVCILGVSFACFALLSPFSELFALGLYALSALHENGPVLVSVRERVPKLVALCEWGLLPTLTERADPAERLTRGVATVWERPAQTVMAVYIAGALTLVLLTLIAVRIRVAPDLLVKAPFSAVYLLVVAGAAILYAVVYAERTLRQFRQNFDPDAEPTTRVEGAFLPPAVLVSLLLDGYVFGDPLTPPGIGPAVVGVATAAGAVALVDERDVVGHFGKPTPESLQQTVELQDVTITKRAHPDPDGRAVTIEVVFESTHDTELWVTLMQDLPFWARPADVSIVGATNNTESESRSSTLAFGTSLPAGETQTVEVHSAIPVDAQADELMRDFEVSLYDVQRGGVDETSVTGTYDIDLPMYHFPPVAIGLFAAVLGAMAPLEGRYLITELITASGPPIDAVSVAQRFVRVFLLVVLPYVPFGIASYRHQIADIQRELGTDPDGFDTDSTRTEQILSRWGVLIALALLLPIDELPVLATVPDPWIQVAIGIIGVGTVLQAGLLQTLSLVIVGLRLVGRVAMKSVNPDRRNSFGWLLVIGILVLALLLGLEIISQNGATLSGRIPVPVLGSLQIRWMIIYGVVIYVGVYFARTVLSVSQ